MNQTRMKPIEDGSKKRREYLRTKVGARILGCIGWGLMVGFGLPTVLFAGVVVGGIVVHAAGGIVAHAAAACLFCLVPTLACGSIVFLGVQCIRNANKMADDNLYVPPVREQIADLPADEVLLRGSDQPVAAPGELLRAARKGTETCTEELLRPAEDTTI